jgi:hypothetical protein
MKALLSKKPCYWRFAALIVPLFLSTPASANIPLPTIMAFSIPFWISLLAFVISFIAVVGVETLVLAWGFRQSKWVAFKLALEVNIITTLIGFTLSLHPLNFLAGFIIIPILATHWLNTKLGFKGWQRALVVVVILAGIGTAQVPWSTAVPMLVLQFYWSIVVAFLLTLMFEACLLAPVSGRGRAWRWSLAANGASYCLLLLVLLLGGFRSGAIADTSWQMFVHSHNQLERNETIAYLQEIYEWEKSADDTPFVSELRIKHAPHQMVKMISTWANNGHVRDAEELFAVASEYRDVKSSDWISTDWNGARESLEEARNRLKEKEAKL